jgi:hypothetical protein
MKYPCFSLAGLLIGVNCAAAADISGTWVAKTENPMMGEVET